MTQACREDDTRGCKLYSVVTPSHRLTEAQQSLQTLGPSLQFTEEGAATQKGEVAIRL